MTAMKHLLDLETQAQREKTLAKLHKYGVTEKRAAAVVAVAGAVRNAIFRPRLKKPGSDLIEFFDEVR